MYGSVDCSFIHHPNWIERPLFTDGLKTDTIYIWKGNITTLLSFYEVCSNLLNDAERAKASTYHQQAHQQRYVLQHGILRCLLSWYLGSPAANIAFTFNPNKKPYLLNSNIPCYFSLSYSGPEILIAISDRELGVDIERINQQFEYRDIAAQYFSAAEVAFINKADSPIEAFFLLWTRKEALLKAWGSGIDDNLPAIPALNGTHNSANASENTSWLTESFNAGTDIIASVAYASPKKETAFSMLDTKLITALLKGIHNCY
ncbi:4'-phosphopantetheinyl transferase family protein [Mucilaginibacter boryungensis]|uniref:4'-phosphopantetheinyl transferase superfamily protein n=1 Tax=Mucilaginibacter boryungensis TaxID=768480 RepID=A0ABR9XBZ9_9SPHI|nr:4'-phosphopantetheinyl transferase superfamily protein [Mucilaginibacter boryungensis]MBE9664898.1 4'-phosphopantetheinyl transferase superfamily protein [Mucilaginibacter boryungensis]